MEAQCRRRRFLWTEGSRGRPPTGVLTVKVESATFEDVVEAIGTLRADESVTLTAKVTEIIEAIHFTEGEEVEAGTLLVELSDAEEEANLAAARAEYDEQVTDFNRVKPLVEKAQLPQERLSEVIALRDAAKARMDSIQARIEDREIRAPFAGRIGLRDVSPGALISPGTRVATLDDIRLMNLDFFVPENFLANIEAGQQVNATTAAYPGEVFTGTVAIVDTQISPNNRSVRVRAEIPNEDRRLRPGMLMRVELVKRDRQSLRVPEESIIALQDSQYVYVVEQGPEGGFVTRRQRIEIGRRLPGVVEVRSGLEEGQQIVVEGLNKVRPGQPVNPTLRSAANAEEASPRASGDNPGGGSGQS